MCKDRLVYVVQMVIVVIEAIVVNQVIWYVIKFDFNFDKKKWMILCLFRVLMVYKDLKEKKARLVHPDHR